MPKRLTAAQVEQYHRDGYCFPAQVLSPEEVSRWRGSLESYEREIGHPLQYPEKSKSYLVFDWADAIVNHPAVLDAVEDVIGPNILCYHTTMWTKEANTPAFVHWHQDGTYFFLDPPEQVTAWVALSDVPMQAGPVRVLPGSHRRGQLEHFDDPSEFNMIKRGQGIRGLEDESGVPMPLRVGELSLHHTLLVHASGPNDWDQRRMGYGISYIPTHVRPLGEPRPSALLVRGVDEYGHYVPEQRPRQPRSAEAWAAHAEANRLFRARQDAGSSIAAQ